MTAPDGLAMSAAQRSALLAASQAVEASNELLRFALEGKAGVWTFPSTTDPVAMLVEALVRTAQIERADREESFTAACSDEVQQLGQLIAALRSFHWDWIGSELPEEAA